MLVNADKREGCKGIKGKSRLEKAETGGRKIKDWDETGSLIEREKTSVKRVKKEGTERQRGSSQGEGYLSFRF